MKKLASFRLSCETLDKAKKLSEETGIPVTHMIETSLRAYLRNPPVQLRTSLFEESKKQNIQ